jgi:hypothetical protein
MSKCMHMYQQSIYALVKTVESPSWGEWVAWDRCTATRGDSTKTRTRNCVQSSCPNGEQCAGKNSETVPCNLPCCPGIYVTTIIL